MSIWILLPMATGCQRTSMALAPPVSLPPVLTTTAAPAAVPVKPMTVAATEAESDAVAGSPTPLLDAALQRAKAQTQTQPQSQIHEQPIVEQPIVSAPPEGAAVAAGAGDETENRVRDQDESIHLPPSEPVAQPLIVPPEPVATVAAEVVSPAKVDPRVEVASRLFVDPAENRNTSAGKTETTPEAEPKTGTEIETAPASKPEARPIDPEKPAVPARPRDAWRDGLVRLRGVARDRAAEMPEDEREAWALRGRLIDWLDASAREEARIDALPHAVLIALEDQAPLEITDLQICRKVKGYGDFEPIDPTSCRPGQGLILYCELAGVHAEPDEPRHGFRSRLTSRVELVHVNVQDGSGPDDGAPLWSQSLGTADDLCRRRRRDYYVNYRIHLPPSIAPGSYELRLIQDDLIAHQTARRGLRLEIQP